MRRQKKTDTHTHRAIGKERQNDREMAKYAEHIEFCAHSVTKYSQRPTAIAPSESLNLIRVMTYSDFLIFQTERFADDFFAAIYAK